MALKPTIFKFRLSLSDMNKEVYDSYSLTVAQHPSETSERMMARVIAFCLNACEDLQFTKGLSSVEEPDLWIVNYSQETELWIDVGEPDYERVKKATRQSKQTQIVSFNTKSDVWWKKNEVKMTTLPVAVLQLAHSGLAELSQFVTRTMDLSVMISGQTIFVTADNNSCEIEWKELNPR
jgi:uncharacterized protein YaeQ